ncbi:hypothetical protein BpHYR1_017685 [Brachionus plicatilis]|uniref:Activin types I and II receptor domain-containing protein n=1 Tax=Brachionus plicatilis TaxID=10195 RepID=A0A3M7S8Y0_BRAPC|nr:hypothetical protein BpHYR1_017685 [Brachionus plicatilis]
MFYCSYFSICLILTAMIHTSTSLKCYSSIGSSDESLKYNDVQTCNEGHTCVRTEFIDNEKSYWVSGCAPLKFCYNDLIANEYIETTIQTYLQKSIKVWRINKKNCCDKSLCNSTSRSAINIYFLVLMIICISN